MRLGRERGAGRSAKRRALSSLTTLASAALALATWSATSARAADLGYAPYSPPPESSRAAATDFGAMLDPRCTVVAMPQADLYGDTARFRPTAICQSRGLYTDSVIFPGPPVVYRGYALGSAR